MILSISPGLAIPRGVDALAVRLAAKERRVAILSWRNIRWSQSWTNNCKILVHYLSKFTLWIAFNLFQKFYLKKTADGVKLMGWPPKNWLSQNGLLSRFLHAACLIEQKITRRQDLNPGLSRWFSSFADLIFFSAMYEFGALRNVNSSSPIAPGDDLDIPVSYRNDAASESPFGLASKHFYAEIQNPIFTAMTLGSLHEPLLGNLFEGYLRIETSESGYEFIFHFRFACRIERYYFRPILMCK